MLLFIATFFRRKGRAPFQTPHTDDIASSFLARCTEKGEDPLKCQLIALVTYGKCDKWDAKRKGPKPVIQKAPDEKREF